MLDANGCETRAEEEVGQGVYSPDEQRIFQSFLATLADLDLDYEHERERIRCSTKSPTLREASLQKLAERHRERREPYIRHLQAQMMVSR